MSVSLRWAWRMPAASTTGPLVAGSDIIACASMACSLSKTGSPSPIGTRRHTHETTPPIESWASRNAVMVCARATTSRLAPIISGAGEDRGMGVWEDRGMGVGRGRAHLGHAGGSRRVRTPHGGRVHVRARQCSELLRCKRRHVHRADAADPRNDLDAQLRCQPLFRNRAGSDTPCPCPGAAMRRCGTGAGCEGLVVNGLASIHPPAAPSPPPTYPPTPPHPTHPTHPRPSALSHCAAYRWSRAPTSVRHRWRRALRT